MFFFKCNASENFVIAAVTCRDSRFGLTGPGPARWSAATPMPSGGPAVRLAQQAAARTVTRKGGANRRASDAGGLGGSAAGPGAGGSCPAGPSAKWGVHILSKNAEYAHVSILYT